MLFQEGVGKGEKHLMNDQTVSQNGSQKAPKKALFRLGQVVATPGALEALKDAGQEADEFLYRHVTGDWGDLDEEDVQANKDAVQRGSRILSAYHTSKDVKIWAITEWDRSVTTLLLPGEY